MRDYEEKISSIMDNAKDDIRLQLNKAYMYGYERGYEDTKTDLGKNAIDLTHEENDRAYQQGLEDAWKVVQNITKEEDKGGYSVEMLKDIFGYIYRYDIFQRYAPQDVIRMIKEYEDEQEIQEIQVGDEVTTRYGSKGIVITDIPSEKGDISVWFTTCTHVQMYPVKDLSKTGKHYDQIPKVLDEMRGKSE